MVVGAQTNIETAMVDLKLLYKIRPTPGYSAITVGVKAQIFQAERSSQPQGIVQHPFHDEIVAGTSDDVVIVAGWELGPSRASYLHQRQDANELGPTPGGNHTG